MTIAKYETDFGNYTPVPTRSARNGRIRIQRAGGGMVVYVIERYHFASSMAASICALSATYITSLFSINSRSVRKSLGSSVNGRFL